MANPIKGEVPLKLSNGLNLRLVLDMEALVEAETAYGKPTAKLMADVTEGFLGATAALLQGALSRHHDVGRSEALEMLQADGEAIAEALTAAVEAGFPDAAKASAEGNGARPKPSPPGKRSGRSGAKPG